MAQLAQKIQQGCAMPYNGQRWYRYYAAKQEVGGSTWLDHKREGICVYSRSNSMAVHIMGIISMNILLVPTLEVEIANMAVCLGNFYQGLLGCDVP